MQDPELKQEADGRTILGVTIRDLGRDKAIASIDKAFAFGKRINVGFANAQTLNVACDNESFRSALSRFLVLNDGLGTDIASRIKFGKPFTENLNGTDFVPDYLRRTKHSLRIYVIGTSLGVVERAAQVLHRSYPRHIIVGWRDGFFLGPCDVEQTCCDIRAAHADCVLVGMGNPLQELWIDEHGHKTGASLFFAVGALLDFQAGSVRRAPRWVRRLRCEWTYRLLQEPERLAYRYLVGNFIFLGRILVDARR
jgi:alpha-1,3-mannosyltransferase